MRGVFRRVPNFSLLGRFDASSLDASRQAVADGMFHAAMERRWEQYSDEFKAVFDPARDTSDEVAAAPPAAEVDDLHEADRVLGHFPRVLSLEQMRDLLHRESNGERTALRDHLGL